MAYENFIIACKQFIEEQNLQQQTNIRGFRIMAVINLPQRPTRQRKMNGGENNIMQ